jgi:cell division protein FtsB
VVLKEQVQQLKEINEKLSKENAVLEDRVQRI